MLKKIAFIIVLFSTITQAQTHIKGTLNPTGDYSWVVLYQLKGAKQLYIKDTTITTDGEFMINFPKNASKGMYRLLYSQQNGKFVNFIYNNKSIELKFNPENPKETVEFLNSEENKIYYNYLKESIVKQQQLDSLQLLFFNLKDENKKIIVQNTYKEAYQDIVKFQAETEKNTKETLASHFIKSAKKYYTPEIIQTPQEYLNSTKQHYFDFIDFKDEILINSTFLSEKIIAYIFYLNGSDDAQVQNALYKRDVQEVMLSIGDNTHLKSEVITLLLYTFTQIENTILIDFIIENFYNKLPESLKDKTVINEVQEKVKLAIGKKAPEIIWEEQGVTKTLSGLELAERYILVFWSTRCSHCLKEIPQLYEYTKDKTNVHVIAFALENDKEGFDEYAPKYTKWTNILGLKKWENPTVRDYQITATPSYFILDSTKKIIAKPIYFKDVKAFFGD